MSFHIAMMVAGPRRAETLRRSTRLKFLLTSLALAAPCQAQDETEAADTAAARRLAVDGVKLAEGGRCTEAIDKLTRSEKLHHSPIVLEWLGECQVALGKVVEGSESLRKVLREELPANPSPALSKALNRAESALIVAKPKIAWLRISVAPEVADVEVRVDGRLVSAALLGDERPADPGEHLVHARAVGFVDSTTTVSLGEGERRAVSLRLELKPEVGLPVVGTARSDELARARGSSASSVRPATDTSDRTPNRVPAYVTWVASGVAAGAGATLGIWAWNGKRDLSRECAEQACPSESLAKLRDSRRFGNWATVAFAAAGAGVVLGTVLFATASTPTETAAKTGRSRRIANAPLRVHGFVGVDQAGIRGDF